MPSVVTKGDSPSRAINRPLIIPIAPDSSSPAAIGMITVAHGTPASGEPEMARITIIEQTATSAHTEPTERSMPPEMITTVMPSDISAM